MRIVICDSENTQVALLVVSPSGEVQVDGAFPGGLTAEDLGHLGFVYYEMDERGEIVTRVRETPPADSLEYVRAVQDALPPGFHVSQVESGRIEAERREKRLRFEEELARIVEED